jgi:hypothetical protein
MAAGKNKALWAVASLAILALAIWLLVPARWSDPVWYSAKYWVHTAQVHCAAKPADCNGCRLKKVVTAYNADGQAVGGDRVPRCKHDLRIGRNIITYDGRTWDALPLGRSCPDLKVSNVEITWTRVQ